MNVNVGITTYNRLEATKECLDSVFRHASDGMVITVVDNGSKDGTREYLKKLHAEKKIENLFLFAKNMGVSCAANQAWAACDTDYFVKLDNDMVVLDKNWLEPLKEIASDPTVGAAAYDVYKTETEDVLLPSGRVVRTSTFCGGSCIMIRRDVHERIGFWNEDYGLYGEEDSDLGGRIALSRLVNAYVDNPGMVQHNHHVYDKDEDKVFKPRRARQKNIYMIHFNMYLYSKGLRPLYVRRKYTPIERNGLLHHVPDAEYVKAMEHLMPSFAIFIKQIRPEVEKYISEQG